uniref:hypothetical protein n=1 Tax=Vibrio campbellii TaxID=680 RepID=UPI001D17FA3B
MNNGKRSLEAPLTRSCHWNEFTLLQMQKSPLFRVGFFKFKAWRCPTLTWGSPTLPSALIRFTSEFGMEV